MRFWTTDWSYNDYLNSDPWPLPGHPEAMKMDPSPRADVDPDWCHTYSQRVSPFNSVTQEPQVHRIVALRARTPDSPEKRLLLATVQARHAAEGRQMWKGSSSDAPDSTCTRARLLRA